MSGFVDDGRSDIGMCIVCIVANGIYGLEVLVSGMNIEKPRPLSVYMYPELLQFF